MKITPARVKWFEQEQRQYGTTTALFNLLWLKAAEDLEALGVKRVSTKLKKPTPRKQAA
jgi:hypothetical protein